MVQYLKFFGVNFLIVYFANQFLPGLEISSPTRLPHIGGELFFALALGLINASLYGLFFVLRHRHFWIHLFFVSLGVNLLGYVLALFIHLGVHIVHVYGYFLTVFVVTLGSFLGNLFKIKGMHTSMTHKQHKHHHFHDQENSMSDDSDDDSI